jgi:hypothetical protein
MIPGNISLRRLAPFAATFAAIYGTLRLVPISAWIGASGRAFTASEFFAPLLGIILGPYAGALAAVIGTFVGISLTGRMNFFGLDFLPVMMNALVLGFLMRKKRLFSVLLYSALLAVFFIHPSTVHFVSVPLPNGTVGLPFVWLHIIAWLLLLSPLGTRSAIWISERSVPEATIAAFVLALIGTTAQHLAGTLLYATMATPLMGIQPEALQVAWIAVFYVYPFERLMIIMASTFIAVAVARAVGAAKLFRATDKKTTS